MNPRPEKLSDRVLHEIKTTDENTSWWHDTRTLELFRQDGSGTGMYFHVPRKHLPGLVQIDSALGYPREDTATDIKNEFLAEVSKKLDGVTAKLVDGQNDTTRVAPVYAENGMPAISYDVVLMHNGKTSTRNIYGLVLQRLGNRTAAQAYALNVESAVRELLSEDDDR